MNPCEELRQKLINDLQNGVRIKKKDEHGFWYEQEIQYNDLLKHYCTATVPRNLFLQKYKSIPPIETMPPEEKTQWKKFVNEIFTGTPPEFRLEAVKIIYTIGIMSEK